jgi:hypothetical protein
VDSVTVIEEEPATFCALQATVPNLGGCC